MNRCWNSSYIWNCFAWVLNRKHSTCSYKSFSQLNNQEQECLIQSNKWMWKNFASTYIQSVGNSRRNNFIFNLRFQLFLRNSSRVNFYTILISFTYDESVCFLLRCLMSNFRLQSIQSRFDSLNTDDLLSVFAGLERYKRFYNL